MIISRRIRYFAVVADQQFTKAIIRPPRPALSALIAKRSLAKLFRPLAARITLVSAVIGFHETAQEVVAIATK
jgi:hypothetical protein